MVFVYIYIYIYIYVCKCVYIHMSRHTGVHVFLSIHVAVNAPVYHMAVSD